MPDTSSRARDSALLLVLDDAISEDVATAGRKAAILAHLRRAGFPVPPGAVVSAASLEGADHQLPPAVRAALARLSDLIGPEPWAVRSSSTVEDAEHASFAGQFETFLNVDDQALPDAVLRCHRSRRAIRARAYGANATAPMAVLIQPMVSADAAGVAFTLDPVSGDQRVVIEAVHGLGEALVSGRATPERWAIGSADEIQRPPSARALDEAAARRVAELARRVESHLGTPQDIEWAMAGGELWLLQARPITGRPAGGAKRIPIEIHVPPGRWERDAFHEPVPLSPFGRVLLTEQVLKVLPGVFAEFGILLDRGEVAMIGGWVYNRLVPLGAPPPREDGGSPAQPPRWMLALLLRLHPAIRRRVRAAREAVAADLALTVIRRWFDEWRPQHQADVQRALALDLGSRTDRALAAELDHRIETISHPGHARVAIAYFVLIHELAVACRDLLGWDVTRMLSLLEGLSTTSTAPARHLAALVAFARSRPDVIELLSAVGESTPERLAAADAEFARAFADYVEDTGHRAVRYDVIEPTLAEQPHVLLRIVADQLTLDFSPDRTAEAAARRRTAAELEALAALKVRSSDDVERFERALARAREAYPAWEDRVWWTQSVQTALLRYLALEIGRRLVARGQLTDVDDVFFLETHEARSALLEGGRWQDNARIRRGERAWAVAHPGPMAYGVRPAGNPPFDLLPSEARNVNEAVIWGFGEFFGTPPDSRDSTVVGTPASAGRYSGPVRVVMGEHEFDKIHPGDVVVCPTTSPTWSVVFPSIGALVADAGGVLSHPAIIAREHGIPAIVGTGHGTTTLRDGQRVIVDGTTGHVEIRAPIA